mgnify:CR=1 FL=1
MANMCYFNLKVIGDLKNLQKFEEILTADYDYDNPIACESEHLFRIYDPKKIKLGNDYDIYAGECAWSAFSCMLDKSSRSNYACLKRNYPEKFKVTTIDEVSKKLNLKIEVFSEETDFTEHIIVDNGDIVLNEEKDFEERYIEETDSYIKIGGHEWEFTI